nr:unnamed protein product [Naegleria fowleri]
MTLFGIWQRKASITPSSYSLYCIVMMMISVASLVIVVQQCGAAELYSVERTTYGVGPDLLEKYIQKSEQQQFQCLQSKEMISFDSVNDNYCDCKDGSDEPGTSACSNAVLSFNSDTKFYCKNKYFKPQYISHSKVNDGVCDCCDGSDENFASTFGEASMNVCEDTCKELGKEIVASLQNEINAMKSAMNSVAADIEYGKSKISEFENQQKDLTQSIADKEKLLEELKTKKDEAEKVEQLEKDLLRAKKKKEWEEQQDQQPKEAPQTPPSEASSTESEATAQDNQAEPPQPPPQPMFVDDEEIINFKLPAAEEVRNQYNQLNNELSNVRNSLNEVQKKLSYNYGKNKEFYKLSESCFEIQQKQYSYEVCPYNKANQKENYSSTLLGNFKEFNSATNIMTFEDGQHCWKVGARKAILKLKCGASNKLVKVDEPSTCEYHLEMETPYACSWIHLTICSISFKNIVPEIKKYFTPTSVVLNLNDPNLILNHHGDLYFALYPNYISGPQTNQLKHPVRGPFVDGEKKMKGLDATIDYISKHEKVYAPWRIQASSVVFGDKIHQNNQPSTVNVKLSSLSTKQLKVFKWNLLIYLKRSDGDDQAVCPYVIYTSNETFSYSKTHFTGNDIKTKKRTRHTEEHDYNNESDEDYEEPPSYDEDPSDEDYSIETDEEIATPSNPSPSRRLTRSTSKSSSCTDSSSKDLCSSDNTNGSNQCMTSESPSKKNKTSNPSTPERNIGLRHEERSWQLFIEEEIDLIKKDLKH